MALFRCCRDNPKSQYANTRPSWKSDTVGNTTVRDTLADFEKKALKVVNYSEVCNKMDQCQNAVPATQQSPTERRKRDRER